MVDNSVKILRPGGAHTSQLLAKIKADDGKLHRIATYFNLDTNLCNVLLYSSQKTNTFCLAQRAGNPSSLNNETI